MSEGDHSYPYDVKITVQGETPRGFMLSVPRDGTKQTLFEESPPPNLTRDIDEFSEIFRVTNPKNDTPFVINDLSGGIGQIYYDDGDPTMYRWSDGVITHVKGKVFPSPKVLTTNIDTNGGFGKRIYCFTTIGGVTYHFLMVNDKLYRKLSNDTWELVWTHPTGELLNGLLYYNDKLFIFGFFSTVDFYVQSNPGASPTWSPTSHSHSTLPNAATKGVNIGEVMYVLSSTGVFFNPTPETNAWSGPIKWAMPGYTFSDITTINNLIFVTDGFAIYSIDATQEVHEVVWQFKDKVKLNNFRYITEYNSNLIFNIQNEVYLYNALSGDIQSLGITAKDSFSIQNVLGLASYLNFIYILAEVNVPDIKTTNQIAVFSVTEINQKWVFEVLWAIDKPSGYIFSNLSATITTGSGVADGLPFIQLFWNAQDTGSDTVIYSQFFPSKWDISVTNQTNQQAASRNLYTSITKARYPNLIKRHTYLEGNFKNLSSSDTIAVAYTTDNGVNYTTLTTFTTNNGSVNYDNVFSDSLGLRITFASSGTPVPILLDIASHQKIRFRYIPTITLSIRVANDLTLRNGNKDTRKIWNIWDDLVAIRITDKDILYEDFWGNSFEVTADLLHASNVKHNHPNNPEIEAILVLTRKDKGE